MFLPENHKEPVTKSSYTKLEEGQHKLRVLSSAIVGYEEWQDKTPVRYKVGIQPPFGADGKELKYFWACIVWNYSQERLQIWEITQKTIRGQIETLVDDEAWGDPKGYDLTVTRKGTTMQDTEYTVMPTPHKEVDPKIVKLFGDTPINLEALYQGDDPFKKEEEGIKDADNPFKS